MSAADYAAKAREWAGACRRFGDCARGTGAYDCGPCGFARMAERMLRAAHAAGREAGELAEREACAALCDALAAEMDERAGDDWDDDECAEYGRFEAAVDLAAAIRARTGGE